MKRINLFKHVVSCVMAILLFPEFICSACGTDIKRTTVNDALNFFGFSSKDQKDAFKSICDQAGIKTGEKFGELEAMNLVDAVQKQFVNRKDKQERWEVGTLDWMDKNRPELMRDLKVLGLTDAVLPQKSEYDAVCILGARTSAMQDRIKFVERLISQGLKTPKIVLLTGERYVTENIDGTKEELSAIAKSLGIDVKQLTETHLFEYLYSRSSLKDKFELVVINTPQKDGRRPTTQTTTEDFCKWTVNFPEVKNVLFISGQPHVKYQKAVVSETLFGVGSSLNFEVVGDKCESGGMKNFIGALGSYIWTDMPACLRYMGIEIKDSIDLAKKLYNHQPWLYRNLPIENKK